jgi:hypothetical protein
MHRFLLSTLFILAVTVSLGAADLPTASPVVLAVAGKAQRPIVVAAKATASVKQSAHTLAEYLEKMSGAHFEIVVGDGREGIALGHAGDFDLPSFGQEPTKTEDYLIRSHKAGVYLVGASDRAVRHAVWDLLYRLGHRQFFPGATWEVIPRHQRIDLTLDVRVQPAYWSRSIWYGFGTWDYNAEPYRQWCERNRMARGIELSTGHAYDAILARNKAAFKEHPEYLGLWQGERKSSHFCISNAGLRKLVIDDSLRQFAAHPERQSLSLEPIDGVSWCQCPECQAMGSVSNRAVTLANEVAAAVAARYPDKYIGMYAYSEHSPPPTLAVHPRVIISAATAFVRGGYTTEQLLHGWQKQGATLGIREYYSVHTWDRDLPGRARGSNLAYLKKTIPEFHRLGARFLSAEASDNWGPNGLGYYVASRLLWDVREADRVDALVDDFLEKAFGPAAQPMRSFYRLLDGAGHALLCDDLVGRMYRLLDEARHTTDDPAIRARLQDLVLYTRYVELFADYSTASGKTRQEAFERLLKFGYRARKTMMLHDKALYRDLARRDKAVHIPTEAQWNVPETKNPWKSSAPFAAAETTALIAAGIKNRPLLDFQPVSFSTHLVPATPLKLPAVKDGSMGLYYRGNNTFLTWLDRPGTLNLRAKAGVVYTNAGDGKFALFPDAEPEGKAAAQASCPPDRADHPLTLASRFEGLHRLEAGAGGGIGIGFPAHVPVTVHSSPEQPFHFHGRWSLYFYVPKGTTVVGGFASGLGVLRDSGGKVVRTFDAKPNFFSVPVPPGERGTLWKFENTAGVRCLMTVPPYLARSARDLLLPAEIVEKDTRRE